jgi:hypothetical protein
MRILCAVIQSSIARVSLQRSGNLLCAKDFTVSAICISAYSQPIVCLLPDALYVTYICNCCSDPCIEFIHCIHGLAVHLYFHITSKKNFRRRKILFLSIYHENLCSDSHGQCEENEWIHRPVEEYDSCRCWAAEERGFPWCPHHRKTGRWLCHVSVLTITFTLGRPRSFSKCSLEVLLSQIMYLCLLTHPSFVRQLQLGCAQLVWVKLYTASNNTAISVLVSEMHVLQFPAFFLVDSVFSLYYPYIIFSFEWDF